MIEIYYSGYADLMIEAVKSGGIEVIGNIFDNTELLKGDTNGKTDNM